VVGEELENVHANGLRVVRILGFDGEEQVDDAA